MPMIGSNDNYVVDEVTLQFFYSCLEPSSPINIISSDELYCDYINVSWEAPQLNEDVLGYNLYRDGELVTVFNDDTFNFSDYGAIENTIHEYCISSFGECGESEFSCNQGSLKNNAIEALNVNASDGLFQDIIVVTWIIKMLKNIRFMRWSWISLVSQNSN